MGLAILYHAVQYTTWVTALQWETERPLSCLGDPPKLTINGEGMRRLARLATAYQIPLPPFVIGSTSSLSYHQSLTGCFDDSLCDPVQAADSKNTLYLGWGTRSDTYQEIRLRRSP